MSETATIQALLALETSRTEALLQKAPGSEAYLWPLARWPIASALASAQLGVTPHAALRSRLNAWNYLRLIAREILPSPRSADHLHGPVDHLFMVSGLTRAPSARGSRNWLCDAFAEALGNSAAVVQEAEFDLVTPRKDRPANPRTWTREPAARRAGRAPKKYPLSAEARDQVLRYLQNFFSELQDVLPASHHDSIEREVLGRVARLPYADAEFTHMIERVRPRRIYMEDASYGHYSSFIRIAHERGIEVAELQHGWIGASHAAYNYGPAFTDSAMTSSLPDSLLTFGEYWGRSLRFPGRIIPIGKQPLEEAAGRALPYRERSHRLLLVSSVYERERLVQFALSLRRLLPASWSIALRPHPSEQADATELFAEALTGGVVLDEQADVNASVASSRAVVGMVSTVLFEALPFGVHIAVIETGLASHYADADVFPQRLDDEDSLTHFTEVLVSGTEPAAGETAALWQPDSVERFLEFAAS